METGGGRMRGGGWCHRYSHKTEQITDDLKNMDELKMRMMMRLEMMMDILGLGLGLNHPSSIFSLSLFLWIGLVWSCLVLIRSRGVQRDI